MAFQDGAERPKKKRKVETAVAGSADPITSSRQLRHLFQNSQAASQEVKAAIDRFRDFLSKIPSNEVTADRARQLEILKEYCDEQSSETHDQVDFPDLISTWQSASQSNDEAVLSAIPSALAQFFRTISTHVEFREFGLSLCHSLLKRDQLRIFDRALSSPRSKEELITPSLQLLTEVVSFDGGALVSNVFGRRDLLYRRLDGILIQTAPTSDSHGQESTAHEAALEFILANLKYLDPTSKTELITHGRLLSSAIRHLPTGRPNIVIETLKTLGKSVLDDRGLSKQTKARCFNSGILSALAKLYSYETDLVPSGEETGASITVRDALHRLLLQACTTSNGVLQPQSGWYPAAMNPEAVERDENTLSLGLDSPYEFDDYSEKVPIKNGTLATFIQTLKPEGDIDQAKLITAIFAAAPELVADYFCKKSKLVVPPGDDPLWRGQFAFLFSVVQLPVPKHCGWHQKLPPTPPPLAVVIESILPRQLDRAIISKGLRMNDELLTISFARLVTIAFEKLDAVLTMFEAAPSSSLWNQASSKLVNLFIDRIPQLQDVVTALQSLGEKDEYVRTAVLECIATYHKVLPSITTASKFDIGPALGKTLHALSSDDTDAESKEVLLDHLPHLVQIAAVSPATKWFHKSTSDEVSLVVQLVKYCVQKSDTTATQQTLTILKDLLSSKGVLDPHHRSLEALLSSLETTKKWQPEAATYRFLDNCVTRTMQRPVTYLDQVERTQQMLSDSKPLSLLACCVSEQWSFVPKKEDKQGVKNIAGWIARLFSALEAAGENYRVMAHFQEAMTKAAAGDEKSKAALEKAFDKQRKKPVGLAGADAVAAEDEEEGSKVHPDDEDSSTRKLPDEQAEQTELASSLSSSSPLFEPLPPIPPSLSGLDRWTKPDFESEIQSGRLANLIRCLISPEPEVHLQAFHTLQGDVMHGLEESTYTEKTQLQLLLGELCETVREHHQMGTGNTGKGKTETMGGRQQPPPSIVAELAIHALPTIADPSSPFYVKLNKLLLHAPSWAIIQHNQPPYLLRDLMRTTFLQEPTADDTTHVAETGSTNAQRIEIEHLLELLCRSLRTRRDVDVFRRAHVFPRLFAYFLTPVCSHHARRLILTLVLRAAAVPSLASGRGGGGSDTLTTRAGVREWFAIARRLRGHGGHGTQGVQRFGELDGELRAWIDVVEAEVERTCDVDAIRTWEGEMPIFKQQQLAQAQAQTVDVVARDEDVEMGQDEDEDDDEESDSDEDTDTDSDGETSSEDEDE